MFFACSWNIQEINEKLNDEIYNKRIGQNKGRENDFIP